MTRSRFVLALSALALTATSSHVALAAAPPDLPLPPCDDGAGACPETSDHLTLPSPGIFSAGGTLTLEASPTIPPCHHQDATSDEFTPAPCYSEIRPYAVSTTCYYIYVDEEGEYWRSGSCSSLLYVDPADRPDRLFTWDGEAYSKCGDRFSEVYAWGGPANVPGAKWSERAADALPCSVTMNGPRPDGLLGPTWVKATATLIVRDNVNPVTERAEVFVPIDGDLREDGTVEMDIEGTQMVIPDHRGEAEPVLDYGLIPAYGDTWTPIELVIKDEDGAPVDGGTIKVSLPAASALVKQRVGLSTSRGGGVGTASLSVQSDADGKATVWLNTSDIFEVDATDGGALPENIMVEARFGSSVASDDVLVIDNFKSLIDRFQTSADVPNGATNALRAGLRPPLNWVDVSAWIVDTTLRFGNANIGASWDDGRQIFCQGYQALTLIFLNGIRHDPELAWLLNGIDYGPVQVVDTDHHYVIAWPSARDDDDVIRVFDPWPSQIATVYTLEEYRTFPGLADYRPDTSSDLKNPGTCYMRCKSNAFDAVLPFFYPTAGGRYPYFPQNDGKPAFRAGKPENPLHYDGCFNVPPDWCQQNGYSGAEVEGRPWDQTAAEGTITIGSPVVFHLDYEDGRRYGFTSPTEFENTMGAAPTGYIPLPEPGDETGWLVDIPAPGPFTLTLTATGDGVATVLLTSPSNDIWGSFLEVPVEEGERYVVNVDYAGVCTSLAMPDGATAPCVCQDTDGDDVHNGCTALPSGDGGGGGCGAGPGDGGAALIVLFGLGAAWALRRRRRNAWRSADG